MEVGGQLLKCSFTVLEDNKVDLLFGLDNLKRHQCTIDLVNSLLHLRAGEIQVPFLSDGQIKKSFGNSPGLSEANLNKDAIKRLMELGYPRDAVVQALKVTDGNEE